METSIKVFIFTVLAAAFAYAQPVDSTAAKDSSQTISAASVSVSSTGEKKAVTGVKTSKPSTNWSKIKDLFL
jgi:hypothetical protein